MEGLVHFAQKVVEAVSNISPFPISLSDENGIIIGATDEKRIGTLHSPSREVIRKGTYILYDEQTTKHLDNVLPGIAVPLKFDAKTIGVLGIIGPPEQVKPYAHLIKNHVEMLWQATLRQQLTDLEYDIRETFSQYLLLHNAPNEANIKQYCDLLSIDFSLNYYCIVIHIGDSLLSRLQLKNPVNQLKNELLSCTEDAFQAKADAFCSFLNTEKIILLKPVKDLQDYRKELEKFHGRGENLKRLFRMYQITPEYIAAGNRYPTLMKIHLSYKDAERLIQFGKDNNLGTNIYHFYQWDLLHLLLPSQITPDFYEKVLFRLEPLFQQKNSKDLINAFITYCECNMSIAKAAKALYIHRNTLIYRLKKIEELISLKINNFEHCMMIYITLKGVSTGDTEKLLQQQLGSDTYRQN